MNLLKIVVLILTICNPLVNLFSMTFDTVVPLLDTIPESDSITNKILNIEAIVKEIKERVKSENDTSDVVGEVKLMRKVKLYDQCRGVVLPPPNGEVNITKVELYVSEGAFKYLRAYTKEGKIFENDVYISITRFRKYRDNRILNIDNDFKGMCEFIVLGDFLDYLFVSGNNYAPSNTSMELDTANLKKNISIKAGLNSFIEFKTYTDFLAVLGEEPNGLVQVEASSRIVGNTGNWIRNKNVFFFNYLEPLFRFSKFDNDFSSLVIDSTSIITDTISSSSLLEIDRVLLNQISKFDIQLKTNLARIYYKRGNYIEVSALIRYQYSDIDYRNERNTANLVGLGGEVGYTLPRYKNFGIDINLSYLAQRITKNTGFDVDLFDEIGNDGYVNFITPEIELYYYPLKNKENQIYLRFVAINALNVDSRNYNQLQIGYKSKISLN